MKQAGGENFPNEALAPRGPAIGQTARRGALWSLVSDWEEPHPVIPATWTPKTALLGLLRIKAVDNW
jgi:hypothetical protein